MKVRRNITVKIIYSNGSEIVKAFDTYTKLTDFIFLEGGHVIEYKILKITGNAE